MTNSAIKKKKKKHEHLKYLYSNNQFLKIKMKIVAKKK